MENILEMVRKGWKVFPCHSIVDGKCTCSKGSKCSSPGKHPRTRQGVKEASDDESVIHQWGKTWPASNWGLATGGPSGVVAIDLDPRHGGYDSFDEYEQGRKQGPLPATLRVSTGGGGRHFFFSVTPDRNVGNRVNWLPGVDVRGTGGYVILPPGNHVSGGTYRWENYGTEMAPLPLDVMTSIADTAGQSTATVADLKDSKSILAGLKEGERDISLFKWACRLRRQHETDDDGGRSIVTHLVMSAAEKANFPADEAMKCIDSAFNQDHEDYITSNELPPLTEIGCRERFIQGFGDDLRFIPELGWYTWSDRGWTPMGIQSFRHRLEGVSQILEEETAQVNDTKLLKEYGSWIQRVQSLSGLRALEGLVESDPRVVRSLDDFDRNPHELACLNGIVDLRTGELRPFSRNDLVTKNTNINYDPKAYSQTWQSFLEKSLGGDQEMLEFLQLAAGYTATGLHTDESFFLITGPAASGKSTYMEAIQCALGTYTATVQSEVFMYRRGGKVPETELARLAGVRMACISEIGEGDRFHDPLIKQVVSGDRVTGRHLYKQTFEYTPQFKIWIATNHDPMSTDKALLRRLKRISFSHTLERHERDPRVKEAFRTTDREAVLAWVIAGASKVYEVEGQRLPIPDAVEAAVESYREEQDIMKMFVDDSLVPSEGSTVGLVKMYRAYAQWCEDLKMRPIPLPSFKQQLNERGIPLGRDDNGNPFFKDFVPTMEIYSNGF